MLFEDLPEMMKPSSGVVGLGRLRLREPRRNEILLRLVDLDSLIGDEQRRRTVLALSGRPLLQAATDCFR